MQRSMNSNFWFWEKMLVLNIPDLLAHWLELFLYIYLLNKMWWKATSHHAFISQRNMLVGRKESGKCMRAFREGTCPKPCKEQPQPFWHAGFDLWNIPHFRTRNCYIWNAIKRFGTTWIYNVHISLQMHFSPDSPVPALIWKLSIFIQS